MKKEDAKLIDVPLEFAIQRLNDSATRKVRPIVTDFLCLESPVVVGEIGDALVVHIKNNEILESIRKSVEKAIK